jgi:hypothetical protein
VLPSGLNATESTATLLPVKGSPSGRGLAGWVTSHSWVVQSKLPLASMLPVGLNATELTSAPAPVRV